MEIRIYAFILNTQISSFSNFVFDAEGKKFQAGVSELGFSYVKTIFPDGTLQQLQLQSNGTVESVFFDGSTWGLNWSSESAKSVQLSTPLTALYDTKFEGSCWAYRSGNIMAIQFDVTFSDMGTHTEKFKIANIPSTAKYVAVSGYFGDKALSANVQNDGVFNLWSNYGIGRYVGFLICFV